jgi:hypothetical protein
MKKQLELQLKQRQLRQAESLESASTQIASPQEESKNLDFAQEDLRRKSLIVRGAITDEIPQQKNTKTFLSTGLSEEFSLLENPESELPEESRLRLWSNPQDSFANEDRVNFDDYYSEDNIPGLFGNSASPINQDDLNDKEIARAIAESIRDMEDRSKFLDQGGIESFYEDLGGPAKRGPVDQGSSNNFLEAQKISDQQYEKGIYREISAGIESHAKSYRDAFVNEKTSDIPDANFCEGPAKRGSSTKFSTRKNFLNDVESSDLHDNPGYKADGSGGVFSSDPVNLQKSFDEEYRSFKSRRVFEKKYRELLVNSDDDQDQKPVTQDQKPSSFLLFPQGKSFDLPAKKSNPRNP